MMVMVMVYRTYIQRAVRRLQTSNLSSSLLLYFGLLILIFCSSILHIFSFSSFIPSVLHYSFFYLLSDVSNTFTCFLLFWILPSFHSLPLPVLLPTRSVFFLLHLLRGATLQNRMSCIFKFIKTYASYFCINKF
jgi:hypothetical protein